MTIMQTRITLAMALFKEGIMVLGPLLLSIRAIFPAAISQANLVCKLHVSTAVKRVIYAN